MKSGRRRYRWVWHISTFYHEGDSDRRLAIEAGVDCRLPAAVERAGEVGFMTTTVPAISPKSQERGDLMARKGPGKARTVLASVMSS